MSEKKQRPSHTKTVLQKITGKRVVNMLPDNDKAEIMNWLLQQPFEALKKLAMNPETPAFVAKSALMLKDEPLERYFALLQQCKAKQIGTTKEKEDGTKQ